MFFFCGINSKMFFLGDTKNIFFCGINSKKFFLWQTFVLVLYIYLLFRNVYKVSLTTVIFFLQNKVSDSSSDEIIKNRLVKSTSFNGGFGRFAYVFIYLTKMVGVFFSFEKKYILVIIQKQ